MFYVKNSYMTTLFLKVSKVEQERNYFIFLMPNFGFLHLFLSLNLNHS